jgi:amino acid adenylation domain-containing protein
MVSESGTQDSRATTHKGIIPHPETMEQTAEVAALLWAERPAIADSQGTLTFAELDQLASTVAANVVSLGVPHQGLVAVALQPSRFVPGILLGIQRAGAAYVPLDRSQPANRVAALLSSASPDLVLFDHFADELPVESSHKAVPVAEVISRTADDVTHRRPSGSDLAYVIFTSGSTGKPKGVMVEHRSVLNTLRAVGSRIGLQLHDTMFASTSLSFDISILELFMPLAFGAKTYVPAPHIGADPKSWLESANQAGTTVAQATPTLVRMLCSIGIRLNSLRILLIGGEAFPEERRDDLLGTGAAIWNLYGPTEAAVWAAAERVTSSSSSPVSLGRPLDGMQFLCLANDGRPTRSGEVGEIQICGIGVARGYLNDIELTKEVFHGDPADATSRRYRTGDLARLGSDGALFFIGRRDNQVKVRGHRVELHDVETELAKHPDITDVAVTPHETEGGDTVLVAHIQVKPKVVLSDIGLRAFAANRLPNYMMPRHFRLCRQLPRMVNGKLDRVRLAAEPLPHSPDEERSSSATPAQLLANLMSANLGRLVEPSDDFFEVGGESVAALEVSLAARQIGLNVDPSDFFTYRTARSIAVALTAQSQNESSRIRVGDSVSGFNELSLTAIQRGTLFACLRDNSSLEDLHSSVWTVHAIYTLTGPVDWQLLRAAWGQCIERHDALRMAVALNSGSRAVLRVTPPPIEARWSEENPNNSERPMVDMAIAHSIGQDFQLSEAPLLQLRQFTSSKRTEHPVVVTSWHALALDGWSVNNLWTEVLNNYHRSQFGLPPFDNQAPQYRNYAAWLAQAIGDEEGVAYWKTHLSGLPSDANLGFPNSGYSLHRASVSMSAEASQVVRDTASKWGVTPSTFFHGAWAMTLAALSRQTGVRFGTMGSGRSANVSESHSIVGPLATTLPVAAELNTAFAVHSWLQQLQQNVVDMQRFAPALMHPMVSRTWRTAGDLPYSSLFSYNSVYEPLHPDGCSIRVEFQHYAGTTGYPITIDVIPLPCFLIEVAAPTNEEGLSARHLARALVRTLACMASAASGMGQLQREIRNTILSS